MFSLFNYIPFIYVSCIVGWFANLPLPKPFSTWSILLYAKFFNASLSEASKKAADYRSIGDFFTRDLKILRPVGSGVVSPVDGRLRSAGRISDGFAVQVKGKTYSIEALLEDDGEAAAYYNGGWCLNFYLSPGDYHGIHAPVSGRIVKNIYVPGRLWPVNDWALKRVDNLFSVNERIATFIESDKFGRIAVVKVGALNVGKIDLSYVSAFEDGRQLSRGKTHRSINYPIPVQIEKGQKLGSFKMGSAVIVLIPSGSVTELKCCSGSGVRYGQSVLI